MGRERSAPDTERDERHVEVEPTSIPVPETDPLLAAHDPLPGLGTLVAIVAHEIHNPITYVLAGLNAIRELLGPLEHTLGSYRALVTRELGHSASGEIASTATGSTGITSTATARANAGIASIVTASTANAKVAIAPIASATWWSWRAAPRTPRARRASPIASEPLVELLLAPRG